ncbi:MAG: hypothetical protein MZV64_29155 [Ignavibacteriales bacterium]|nr:hypothetical protein [Ignavibacteriales bacterium]
MKENGEGLLHWFFNQNGSISGFTNAFWSGVTTLFLASAIDIAIDQNITGLYHVTNGTKISKYDLLNLAKKVWEKDDLVIKPFEGVFVDKSFINTRDDKSIVVPSYAVMFDDLKKFMELHSDFYKQYALIYQFMKILIVGEVFYPEEFLINDLALEWKKNGFHVDVLTRVPSYPQDKIFPGFKNKIFQKNNFNGITVFRFPVILGYQSSKLKKIINYINFVFCGSIHSGY